MPGMIRREVTDSWLLITQQDHAQLAGKIAEHLNFFRVTESEPDEFRTAAIAAIYQHDAGWIETDQMGILNSHAEPIHVFEIPTMVALETWSQSVELARDLHPYTTLLVSIHQMALSTMVINHASKHTPLELFSINKFQHKQSEFQEDLREQLGLSTTVPLTYGLAARGVDAREDLLRSHFRLLTFCDRLSLELCCGHALFDIIDDVPRSKTIRPVNVQTAMPDANRARIQPWPFATDSPITVTTEAVQMPHRPFASPADFIAFYRQCNRKPIQFHLQNGR